MYAAPPCEFQPWFDSLTPTVMGCVHASFVASLNYRRLYCANASGIGSGSAAQGTCLHATGPVFSWTGFYVGGNAGYGWGRANATYVAPGGPNGWPPNDQGTISANGSANLDPTGFVGGAQIGYNWQFASTWVLGVETDFQAFKLSDSFDHTFPTATGELSPQITHTKVSADWLFTLRGRLGYVSDRLLIYGTGGLAVAKVNFQQTNSFPSSFAGDPALAPTDYFSASNTKTGWTVGGGLNPRFGTIGRSKPNIFTSTWATSADYPPRSVS